MNIDTEAFSKRDVERERERDTHIHTQNVYKMQFKCGSILRKGGFRS
jgi:hypothetical protein